MSNSNICTIEDVDLNDMLELERISEQHLSGHHFEDKRLAIDLLGALSKIFKTNRMNFFFSDRAHKIIDATKVSSIGVDQYYHKKYKDYYYTLSPFVSPLPPLLVGSYAGTVRDIMPYSSWTKLEFYEDFLKPQKIHHEMIMYLRSRDKLFGCIGLFRSKGDNDFSQNDVLKARFLAPYIAHIFENIELIFEMKSERDARINAQKLLPQGILLMDFEFRLKYYNSEARDMLQLPFITKSAYNSDIQIDAAIPSQIKQDCIVLKQLYASKKEFNNFQRHRIIQCDKISKTFRLRSTVISLPWQGLSTPYFLISLEDISGEVYGIEDKNLRKKYNLSKREIELAQYVSMGLTNDEIARELFISKFTVQRHLQNIFEKTGANNRISLARLIYQYTTSHINIIN